MAPSQMESNVCTFINKYDDFLVHLPVATQVLAGYQSLVVQAD